VSHSFMLYSAVWSFISRTYSRRTRHVTLPSRYIARRRPLWAVYSLPCLCTSGTPYSSAVLNAQHSAEPSIKQI